MNSTPASIFPLTLTASSPQSSSEEQLARPFFPDDSTAAARAARIKKLLMDLSREETDGELKSAFRQTADFLRESFFGLTEKQIRSRIRSVLEEYFDGETYTALEIENIAEETRIEQKILLPVLEKMVAAKIILRGQRRRWNELGEHYNFIYKLKK